jgi:hypothetical protein
MKKYIFLSIGLLCFVFAEAQTIEGGIRGGVNYSFFTEETKKDNGNVGFEVGYYEVMTFESKYKLQAEANYVKNIFNNSDTKTTTTYNYLEVPLLFKHEIASNFDIGAGVKYVFGLSGKEKTKADDINGDGVLLPSEGGEGRDLDSVDGGFGFVAEGVYRQDKINVGLRLNYGGGQVLSGFNRTSANLYISYKLF